MVAGAVTAGPDRLLRRGKTGKSPPPLSPWEFSSSVLLPPCPPLEMYQFSMVETAPVGTLVGRVRAEDADVGENTDMAYQIKEEGTLGPFRVATDSNTQEALISLQQVSPELGTGSLPSPGGQEPLPTHPPAVEGEPSGEGLFSLPCVGPLPNARGQSRGAG